MPSRKDESEIAGQPGKTGDDLRAGEKRNVKEKEGEPRYRSGSYADAGGESADKASSPAGGEKWENQGGAGYGENYGAVEDKGDSGGDAERDKK